jgi:pimeloyl-ACP methyl ester carboxylesterase
MQEEKFIAIQENKIRYLEDGASSNVIMLVHGLGASAERWDHIMPYFRKNYCVIVPDLPGFGLSDKPSIDYTIDFFVRSLSEFIESLGIQNSILVGSSFGGQIITELAIAEPKLINKMILVSPSGVVNYSTIALNAYISAAISPTRENVEKVFFMMNGQNKDVDSKTVDDFITRMNMTNAKQAFLSTILSNRESKISCEKLANVSVPSLVIWGEHDPVIPKENADLFFSCIKNCQFVEMKNCGHTPFVDEPKKFSKIVLEFLKEK